MKFVKVTKAHEVLYINADHIHWMSQHERNEGGVKESYTLIRFSLDVHDKVEVKETVEEILKQL
ncbi:hypothetical protein DOM22_14755 [Bdellovibrio sp. ZAP7]|uniref:hypothetical protein n=1 Tax=Bdellovibrio sp. ZAP7 TaxID=2231053 RepID=UPI00115B572C|nr:hypothetical protein [Bdellovibrio sp. ZAP7]QDK46335.1 hypothetical protein DOM22_14755 [Bdellovibrio sp. ZAP7]